MAFIGDENTTRAPANLEWMEQRMPKRRSFKKSTSLKERLAMEATQLRKEAQGIPPGLERELLVRKARRAETASRMIEWLTSAPKHQDRFKQKWLFRLLENSGLGLGPKEVGCIIEASLAHPLRQDRDDPLTEMIATKIIKFAQTGVHDPAQLSALAIKELSVR